MSSSKRRTEKLRRKPRGTRPPASACIRLAARDGLRNYQPVRVNLIGANPWEFVSTGSGGRLDVAMTEDGSVLEATGGQPLRSLSSTVNITTPQYRQAQSVAIGGGWVWIVDWQGVVQRVRI